MDLHQKTGLKADTLDKLQSLVRQNRDSSEGHRLLSEKVDDHGTQAFFRGLAKEHAEQADELARVLRLNEEEPSSSGTAAGSLANTWAGLRASLNQGDPAVVLKESCRQEDRIRDKYRDAIRETSGSPVNDVLHRHLERTMRNSKQLHELQELKKES